MPTPSRLHVRLPGMVLLGLCFSLTVLSTRLQAEEVRASFPKQHRLTLEEYESTLRFWRNQHPKWITLERRGVSAESLPIYLVKITDSSVPDKDKQVCLVTALHSGPERTGATGTLAVMEWLLGESPDAAETRRKQVVLFMPIMNPLAMFYTDRFRNDHGVDPYTGLGRVGKIWDIKKLSLAQPQDSPELAAFVSVVDQYQPEMHADLHGTGLQEYSPDQLGSHQMYEGQIMTEIAGGAYSNFALRPWDWRITESMIAAGREAGFPSDRFEADAERTYWGPEMAPLGGKLWHGMPLFYSAHYGYAKYHTMLCTQEVSWEQSVVARMQALFRIGNHVWQDERTAGYPVNRLKYSLGNFVTAVGINATERRCSRVELWNKQENLSVGFLYPQTAGRASFVCAANDAAKKAVASHDIPGLIQNLRSYAGAASENLARFLEAGPELKLAMDKSESQLLAAHDNPGSELEHGIGFRLRLPYPNAANLDVCLNGEPLKCADLDGYESWTADGFTQVQVNLSPAKARSTGLFFITCGYVAPKEDHSHMAWLPPAEVRKQCASAVADATPATFTDLPYGPHFHQTMDVWLANGDRPSPMVFYIHGGGWAAQDKTDIHQHLDVGAFLNAGISVASINYRLLQDANAAKISPPVQWPLLDAARALQFVRSKAGGWHLDKGRIAVSGVSAGGCSSLWLAFHDDLADPQSADPIARESTRPCAAAVVAPVVSLDPQQVRTWIPNAIFGAHAFGFADLSRKDSFEPFLAEREKYLPDIKRYSPYELVSKTAPPIFVEFPNQDKLPVRGDPQTDPSHSALSGVMLEEKMKALGVPMELRYKNDGRTGHQDAQEYLLELLSKPGAPAFRVKLDTISSGFDKKSCWVHPRAGAIPGNPPSVVLTMQKAMLVGSDVFYALNEMRTDDLGKTWSGPVEHADTLGRRDEADGVVVAASDFWPKWHAKTGRILGIGHDVRYKDNKVMPVRARETVYSVYDAAKRTWTPWNTLTMPDKDRFYNAGAGCSQRVDLPDGDILLPIYYTPKGEKFAHVTVLRCGFDGRHLAVKEIGNELRVDTDRGLDEPSLTRFQGHYYLTIRHDLRAYVSSSDDGMHFSDPQAWTWDDGKDLGSYNTQAHWVTHDDALYLVYTRRGANNDHIMRNRAPLFMAQVDPQRMCVVRATECELMPQRGAKLGNFGVTEVNEHETWVTDAEWMQTKGPNYADFTQCMKYGSDNAVFAARILWKKPNTSWNQH